MKTVLVTGGIGSGKSAVCAYLASRGVPVYDSDSRTKALYDTDPALLPALEKAFGTSLRSPSGELDRAIPSCCGIFYPGRTPSHGNPGAATGRFLSW